MTPNDRPQHSAAPPAPSRVRVVRPAFYRSERTGSLPPDVRDLLIALTTVSDDEGWLLWRPAELAAWIYPYSAAGRRVHDLEKRAAVLIERELIAVEECGCAVIPTLVEHHGVKGGNKSSAIWGWHQRHKSVHVRTDPSESVSGTSSSLGSDSFVGSGSSSSRARDEAARDEATCIDCKRPTSVHSSDCPQLRNPSLSRVAG